MDSSLKKELILKNLDCANCAAKIENRVKKLEGVRNASVDFTTQTLVVEAFKQEDLEAVVKKASELVVSIESGIKVEEKPNGYSKPMVQEDNLFETGEIIKFSAGGILFLTGIIFNFSPAVEFLLFFISFLLIGGKVLLRAAKNILKGQVFDENFLMSIATIGAFSIGEAPEGAAVMIFYQVGEFFQELAVKRSRKSISDLMDIRPDYANLKSGGETRKVSPDQVNVGDIIIINPGEKVPLDGIVLEGFSTLDTSALTGESAPVNAESGSTVLSGSINKTGLLTVEVTKEFGDSTVVKILELVENAGARKAPTENFITKFAGYYTPAVVIIAAALAIIPPLVIQDAVFSHWLRRALVFLVVSCPCALVISIPLGFYGGIGGASKNGILVKGGNFLEALNKVDTVILDKTGTLTKGTFTVTEINPESWIDKDELLLYAAGAESHSSHPIALSLTKAYGKDTSHIDIGNYSEIPGHGISADVSGHKVLAGNYRFLNREGIVFPESQASGTAVYIGVDGKYAGNIIISDVLKDDSVNSIKALKALGVKRIVMLTGDSSHVAEDIGKKLGIHEIFAGLLPHQKVEILEKLESEKALNKKLMFVGDGINDAPVLARADIGVAMGALGSDAAIEAADIVLMTDEPSKLSTAIKISKKTNDIVWQNIIFALGTKGLVLVLGAFGYATMWAAVFADVGVALLAVSNAMRVMRGSYAQ